MSRVQGCRVTDDEGNAFDIVAPLQVDDGRVWCAALVGGKLRKVRLPYDVSLAWLMAGKQLLPGPVGFAEVQAIARGDDP